MRNYLIFIVCLAPFIANSQDFDFGFPFGKVSPQELAITSYEKDTSAVAVYLDEFGETSFDNGDSYNLIHKYHAKIKILRSSGLERANIEIPLYRSGLNVQKLRSIKASSFNIDENVLKETPFEVRKIFTENRNKYWEVKKVAIPNVKVGSVIEIAYELESPFFYNFKTWEFQADIPKMKSDYVAIIPAVYNYNVSLTGFLKLTKNQSKILKGCLSQGQANAGGFSVDCSHFTYGMVNIPAFREEEYMTAKKNFLSAINFELSEIKRLNGSVDKVTKEWKDAESELKKHPNFGVQLKKNGDLLKEALAVVTTGENDTLARARKIYRFVQQNMEWNGDTELFSDGIKAAIEKKKGSSADINLFLVGAMREQGIETYPVILSTRDNGIVGDLYPVISAFNYVVAAVKVGGRIFLLDATDDFHPFGVLPARCLNGKGRILYEKGSAWIELKPGDRGKHVMMVNLKLGDDGFFRGTLQSTYSGYEAVNFRKEVYSHTNQDDYLEDLKKNLHGTEIANMELVNLEEYDKPVVQKLEVVLPAFDNSAANSFLFNPFILGMWKENPFKSSTRLYPVDFGTPIEFTTILNMEYPANLEIVNLPDNIGLALPNSGGRYIVDAKGLDNKITLTNSLLINKTVFSSQEYYYLRELFQKVIEVQNTDLMFRKKT